MARSTGDLDRTLRRLGWILTFFEGLCVFGAIAIVRLTVRRGLAPLDHLARQAESIDAGNLKARFPAAGLPFELAPISARLNELLERLEAAFRREKRFTADVAHELRNPIAELRTMTEVGLRSFGVPSSEAVGTRYLHDVRAIALQMEGLVTALLTIARCDSNQLAVTIERIDLVAVLNEAWRSLAEDASKRALRIVFAMPENAAAESDRTLLLAILTNVLSNAVAYTPAKGEISVAIVSDTGTLAVIVSNTTDKLNPEDLPHLTEPFWRKDVARSDMTHSGVGLAVIASLTQLLDLELSLELAAPDRFVVELSGIPASPDP